MENPSSIVMTSSNPNFFTVARADWHASLLASIAYTLPAPIGIHSFSISQQYNVVCDMRTVCRF